MDFKVEKAISEEISKGNLNPHIDEGPCMIMHKLDGMDELIEAIKELTATIKKNN